MKAKRASPTIEHMIQDWGDTLLAFDRFQDELKQVAAGILERQQKFLRQLGILTHPRKIPAMMDNRFCREYGACQKVIKLPRMAGHPGSDLWIHAYIGWTRSPDSRKETKPYSELLFKYKGSRYAKRFRDIFRRVVKATSTKLDGDAGWDCAWFTLLEPACFRDALDQIETDWQDIVKIVARCLKKSS